MTLFKARIIISSASAHALVALAGDNNFGDEAGSIRILEDFLGKPLKSECSQPWKQLYSNNAPSSQYCAGSADRLQD